MKKQLMIAALAALFSLPLLAADPAPLSQGEVRKVDVAAQKITLRHGPIASIGMPPMTMVFEVEKPELLEGVSAGEKVSFQVQQQGNRYIVTELQVMQ
ncbi:copper-binding protein [Pseudomonas sp. EggHat1]|uniref:copper-binding protein n=1 Tax=Pseudomonas sp. EggHat1 TaxID=2761624 RepID=UPI0018679C60|nr:copper-binding protein [Pseudomonas sp. EggHat1]